MKKKAYLFAVLSIFMMWSWVPDAGARRYYVKESAYPINTAADAIDWGTAVDGDSLQSVLNVAKEGDTVFVAVGDYQGGFFMKEGVQVLGGFDHNTGQRYPVDTANWRKCSVLRGNGSMRVLTQLTPFTRETVWDGFVIYNGSATGGKGQIVFNADGTAPAGIIYRWDATTHSGYMVGLEQGVSKEWGGYGTDIPDLPNISSSADAKKDFSGSGNTALIVKTLSVSNYAAHWCDTLSAGGFRDWYLPACGELYELYNQRYSVHAAISQIGCVASAVPALKHDIYWSGSERGTDIAWVVSFGDGDVFFDFKDYTHSVRAVRALNLFTHLDNLTFSGGGALLQENGVLRRCVVTGNKAAGMGGGVYTRGGSVEGCLVTGNRSGRGSGIYAATSSVVTSSTITDNRQDTLNIAPRPAAAPAVGDYYYTDGSYSKSTGSPLPDRELAGIVCYINPSNPYAGFIMDTAQVKKEWTDAVEWARDSVRTGGYTDWKLPSVDVLSDGIYAGRTAIGDALSQIGATLLNTNDYWSGLEFDLFEAYFVNLSNGVPSSYSKLSTYDVRAVRAFNLFSNINNSENAGLVNAGGIEVTNSIFWINKEQGGSTADYSGDPGDVSYSCAGTGIIAGSNGNKDVDPHFVSSGNYRLKNNSDMIDAGRNSDVPSGLTTDLDANRRRYDVVDLGAYEYKKPLPLITVTTPQKTTYTGENLYITPGTTNSDTILEYKYINRAAPADTLTAAKNAGEYDVLVISPSIGDFAEDSIKVPFTVKKDSIILELTAKNTGYTGSPVAIDTPAIRGGTAATDLAGTLQIQYDGNPTPPTASGSYTVTATIAGDNNHIGTTATTTLTITAGGASLFMADKTVVYDDEEQKVEAFSNPAGLSFTYSYEGTDGTSYGPTPTPPTDAGTYTVTATFVGNGEYVAGSVQARLTIEKAPVTVYVGSQTVIDGGTIREEATVIDAKGKVVFGMMFYTYKGIGDTNYPETPSPLSNTATGTYQVTVAFAGDNNYLPATGTGILTILPPSSSYPGIYLPDAVVVFGHSYTMEAVTEPATGLSPTTYTYSGTTWDGTAYPASSTAPTAAGRYTVKAVSGTGTPYTQSSTTTANLKIQKAPQTINMSQAQFDGKNELNIGDVIPVIATVSSPAPTSPSGFPVTLTSSDPSVADFSFGTNNLTIRSVGSTMIKAEVTGNTNYEAAAPVYRLLYVKGGKVTIENPLHVNGHSDPSETTLCDADSYDLSLTAAGDILDYTWYREGQQIATTTDSICTITESGAYTVDVNGVLDTVSSGPVTVLFSSSPVITKDLQDAAIVGGPVTLGVEATGPGLKYQWYFNNRIIDGEVAESLKTREEGAYYVLVSNECGSVQSATAYVTEQIVPPIINRRVDMPQVEGIHTDRPAGTHYIRSQNDFVFEMWPAAGYSLDYVTVTTDGGNVVEVVPSETEGRVNVTIKRVNASIRILINGVSPVGNQPIHTDTRIWSHNGKLYISLPSAQEISVYTLTGSLHERRDLPAGDTVLSMPAGVYIITLDTGTRQKVVIN